MQNFKIIHETQVSGTINRVFGNYAFIKLVNNRELFVHLGNVPISKPNLKLKFVEQLIGLDVIFDIAQDKAKNKPSAINVTLQDGSLIDTLPIWHTARIFTEKLSPYSPPKSSGGRFTYSGCFRKKSLIFKCKGPLKI